MKRFFTFLVLVFAFLAYSELNITLKDSGYISNYIYPFYLDRIEPRLVSISSEFDLPIFKSITAVPEILIDGRILASESAVVTRVIDGDTIDVLLNGEVKRVRYVGINTPERDEPCFRESTRANQRLVANKRIRLAKDETNSDQYGRLLRYVYVGDVLVERELVIQGYAESVLYGSDDRHYREFRRLEREATELGLGCHPSGIFDDGDSRR